MKAREPRFGNFFPLCLGGFRRGRRAPLHAFGNEDAFSSGVHLKDGKRMILRSNSSVDNEAKMINQYSLNPQKTLTNASVISRKIEKNLLKKSPPKKHRL